MHDHLQSMDFDNLDRMPTGQLVARANSDSTLVQGLLSFFPIMSGNVLLMLLSLGVMIYLSPLLAIVSLIVAPALLIISYRMRWRIFPATWDGQQREGDVAQIVDEDVNGVRVVKAFGQEHRELDRVVDASQTLYGSQMRAVRLQSRYQPLLEAIPTLGQVAHPRLRRLAGPPPRDHARDLPRLLDLPRPAGGPGPPARRRPHDRPAGPGRRRAHLPAARPPARHRRRRRTPIELPPLARRGRLLRRALRATATATRCSRASTCASPPARRVAIVGPERQRQVDRGDAGLALLRPDRGAVLVDGHDVRDVSLRSLRRQVGVVFEESFLFSDTVRANIAYGRPEATDAEVEAAARAAEAHEFIERLPRGYDTVVGERGLTLSGGQRQRIALARAHPLRPAHPDPRRRHQRGRRQDRGGASTTRLRERHGRPHDAARSPTAARRCTSPTGSSSSSDGRVVDQGTHDELLARSALYRVPALRARGGAGRAGRRPDRGARRASRRSPGRTAPRSRHGAGHRRPASPAGPPAAPSARRASGPGSAEAAAGGGSTLRRPLSSSPGWPPCGPSATSPPSTSSNESRHDRRFNLRRLLSEFRRPLARRAGPGGPRRAGVAGRARSW